MRLTMKNAVCFMMVFVLSLGMTACGGTDISKVEDTVAVEQEETVYSEGPTRKVIIDTDTGADDASALILAAKSQSLDILGVTVLMGNVDLDQGTENALMALELAGCDAPVYKGAADRFSGEHVDAFSVFGLDGMGEKDLIHPAGKAQDEDAIDFILRTVRENPDEVEIICLGPATNIALAMDKDPDTMKKVKRIWSMGTTGLGAGNASPVAEFNVYNDAEAYKRMLDFDIPMTIIGLDVCDEEAAWTAFQFEELMELSGTGKFVADSFSKIREFYDENGAGGTVMNCDCLAMTCIIYPDFVKDTVSCHGSCITEQGETYGQVIFYKKGFTYDLVQNDFDYNVELISDVAGEDYFDLFKKAITD